MGTLLEKYEEQLTKEYELQLKTKNETLQRGGAFANSSNTGDARGQKRAQGNRCVRCADSNTARCCVR